MPVATTTEAGREVLTRAAQKLLNDRERRRVQADAQRAAAALNGDRVDTTTPLVGPAPLETIPEPPKPARPVIVLSTTIAYRGRIVTIQNEGMTLDAFCDMLDKRLGAAE